MLKARHVDRRGPASRVAPREQHPLVTIATGGIARRRATVGEVPSTPRLAVLSSKLERPYRRPGIIDRPGLLERVTATSSPMVGFVAPAGYGKSTALAQYADATSRPTAWLSADHRDSDAATLLIGLAAAVDRVAPLSEETASVVARPGSTFWTAAVPRLGAAIAAIPGLRLVVDDVDRIEDLEAADVLLALAAYLGPGARLIIGGRSLGRLPQARLVASGQLTVFGREDLALDPSETARLLVAMGLRPTEESARRLTDRTEGWAAAIYLSSLGGSDRAADRLGIPQTATGRGVEEFLRTEVLGAMSAQEADFVLRASVLDRLSGPLCDHVLDRDHSGSDLDRIERRNLFLIPLDPARTWYRFHHLLGDFLRAELERRDGAAAAALRQRSAHWHADHGLHEAALEYAIAAGDEELAARLVLAVGQEAVNHGRMETVRRWFGWFDDRGVGQRDAAFAAQATMIFALAGDLERAERWSAVAAIAADAEGGVAGRRGRGLVAIAGVLMGHDGAKGMSSAGQVAVESIDDADPYRVAALVSAGAARLIAGDTEAGRQGLLGAIARFDAGSIGNVAAIMALTMLAADALAYSDRSMAEANVRRARSIIVSHHLSDTVVAVGVDALDARLALAHGATEQAKADLAHAQRLRPQLNPSVPWLAIRARLDLVRAHMALHDPGGARTLMAEIRDILRVRPDMGTLVAEFEDLDRRLEGVRGGTAGVSTLTLAELRLLPLLTTRPPIVPERSASACSCRRTRSRPRPPISIYRKLEVTSRSEAIERAVELGLLGRGGAVER